MAPNIKSRKELDQAMLKEETKMLSYQEFYQYGADQPEPENPVSLFHLFKKPVELRQHQVKANPETLKFHPAKDRCSYPTFN